MLSTTLTSIQYTGNGTTSAFTFPYLFYQNSHLTVILNAGGTGDPDVTQTLDVDYTVSGAGEDSGGIVTMTTAPAASSVLTIKRIVPLTQLVDLIKNDEFDSTSVERGLDLLTMICQQQQDVIGGSTPITPTNISFGNITGTTNQKSLSVNTGTSFLIRAWLIDGSNTTPVLPPTLIPPDGNTEWTGKMLEFVTDAVTGAYTFTFNHSGTFAQWRLCVESSGGISLSEVIGLG